MKKLLAIFFFMFLMGCSRVVSSTVAPGVIQTPALVLSLTVIPPTQTLISIDTATSTPTLAPTPIGGGTGKIAFVSERDGYPEIYVVNSDGSNLIKLANSITPKLDPAWSPDGRKIAFASNNNASASLYIMNADGSNPIKLIDAKDLSINSQANSDWRLNISHPVWSPDGKKLAFNAGHSIGGSLNFGNIYVIDVDGSHLINPVDHSALDGDPTWSPDSQKIAFSSSVEWDKVGLAYNSCGVKSGGICVMNADGTNLVNLTSNQGGSSPLWSPDGKKIVFANGWGGNAAVYAMDADGTNLVKLTRYGSPWDQTPIWSPDGKKIAFISYRDGNSEVYMMNADGTNLVNLTNNPTSEDGQAWSPDSTKIAFVSNRNGNSEIYVINADGTNLVGLTDNKAEDYFPVWSP